MGKCNRCNKEKDKSEFVTSEGKPSTRCVLCRIERNKQAKKYYEKRSTLSLERRVYFKIRTRNASLKRKYGITYDEFENMFLSQHGLCGICGQGLKRSSEKGWGGKREACVDHDHKTGKVRGILCRGCNLSLSMIEDEVFQQKSNQYLSKFKM